jgi:hypothetical protein
LDTDTHFLKDPKLIFERIENGEIFMDCRDGRLDEEKTLLIKKIHRVITKLTVFGGKIKIEGSLVMWVAGAIGFNSKISQILPDVLALTDELYSQYPKHVMEQIAFCYYLQKFGEINATTDTIFHYWNFKEFREILREFLVQNAEKEGKTLAKLTEKILPIVLIKPKIAYQNMPFLAKTWRKLQKKRWELPHYNLS